MPFFMGKLFQIRKDAVWAPTRLGKKRDIQKSARKTRGTVFSGGRENRGLPREKVLKNAEIAQIQAQN
jgi:hypothetical protein